MEEVIIDTETKTVRPTNTEGDAWYGLARGTNGTGPTMRRFLVGPEYRWVTSRGAPALGVTLVPTGDETSFKNPWR